MTDPVMPKLRCGVHQYGKVPLVLNVMLKVNGAAWVPESQVTGALVSVEECPIVPAQVHKTESPTLMLVVEGEKARALPDELTVTLAVAPSAVAVVPINSHPANANP
jgi:hypothetical protein